MDLGIDVSRYQLKIDWPQVSAFGIKFAYVKVSELTTVDPFFKINWTGAKAAGIPRGGYFYFRPQYNVVNQVNFFLTQFGDDLGELTPVIDVETSGGLPPKDALANTKVALDLLEQRLGFKPVIYTGLYTFNNEFLGNASAPLWFQEKDYTLWLAQYNNRPEPTVPNGFKTWSVWQYTDKGIVPGISKNVDMNRMKPDSAGLFIKPIPVIERTLEERVTRIETVLTEKGIL